MKKFYNILILLLIGLGSSAQTKYVYTAVKDGMWNDMTVWNIVVRNDGVPKDKVIIPSIYTVTADNGVNSLGLGDIQVEISGALQIAANTQINLTANSSVQLIGTGRILGVSTNQRIRLGTVVKYNGSLDGTKVGPSIADNLSGVSPNGFRSMTLPVTFVNFYLLKKNGDVEVHWATGSEINNNHFEIERSGDGKSWSMIAMVLSLGNSNSTVNYSYTDKNNKSALAYYRIKQVDIDGRATYTAVRTIKNDGSANNTDIFSNKKNITIKFDQIKSVVSVKVFNLNGQAIMQQTYNNSAYISFGMNNSNTGLYIVQVTDENNQTESKKVMLY
ncbi:MAG TPA: T9SS type A sorting domain-containing protein [Chitinophagaceae bacterium]|nr:T9SS type A sorting domain-containing protein [Chitinophagaceae bacterium]